MNSTYWLVIGIAVACSAQVVACSSDFSSCTASRSCASGGSGGEGESTATGESGAGDAGQTSDSGKAGHTSAGGHPGGGEQSTDAGAAGEGGAAELGAPVMFGRCAGVGTLACDGHAAPQRLACDGTRWQAGTTCAAGQLCDSTSGKCLAAVAECAAAEAGGVVCREDKPLTCGPDLVTATEGKPCEGACEKGVCLAPACGDGKVQAGEACDDGNKAAGDGCSATCTVEPIALALGFGFSCALGSNGVVKCWGDNSRGSLGLSSGTGASAAEKSRGDEAGEMGAKLAPVYLGAKQTAKAITAGRSSACAVLTDGSLKCWGGNEHGQLGNGNQDDQGDQSGEMANLTPVYLGSGRTVKSITTGGWHTCAVLDTGDVKCWGYNVSGQLGQGSRVSVADPGALPPVPLADGAKATWVGTSSFDFSCALLANGRAKCWGENGFDQLCYVADPSYRADDVGDEPGEMKAAPSFGFGGHSAQALAVGERTACALLDDGQIQCWGENAYGEGDAGSPCYDVATYFSTTPAVSLSRKAKSISLTTQHTCAVLEDGAVVCWGENADGQLGVGSKDNVGLGGSGQSVAKLPVPLPHKALQVATGGNHTCALLDDGTVRCWGGNELGQLGVGTTTPVGDAPGFVIRPVDLQF